MKQVMPTFASLLLFCIHFTYIFAQSLAPAPAPPAPTTVPAILAPAPAPPAPTTAAPPAPITVPTIVAPALAPKGSTNVITILKKAGGYTTFIRLLKSTQTADRISKMLFSSNQGITIFAPDDAAFAKLKAGSLNSYTDQQKSELIQSHILSSFFLIPQFVTASNPMSTQAGGTNYGEFPLNVTASGTSVNLTTGFANASVISTVYTDGQLAVYQVDHVLLPQKFFVAPPPSPPPAPAPAPAKHKKAQSANSSAKPIDSSDANTLINEALLQASYVFAVLAASWLFG